MTPVVAGLGKTLNRAWPVLSVVALFAASPYTSCTPEPRSNGEIPSTRLVPLPGERTDAPATGWLSWSSTRTVSVRVGGSVKLRSRSLSTENDEVWKSHPVGNPGRPELPPCRYAL